MFTRMSRKRFMWCPSRVTASISRSMANCAYTAAAPAEMNGRSSRRAFRIAIATLTFCAKRWPWTRSTSAASISEPPGGRFTVRPTQATRGTLSYAICRPCSPWKRKPCHERQAPRSCSFLRDFRRAEDAFHARSRSSRIMITVVLPPHLRTLAHVSGDVQLDLGAEPTARSLLDALETRYPMLQGTIRDHATQERRAYVRFFACEQDLSHESLDTPLPAAVASGAEPFFIIGAIAGG